MVVMATKTSLTENQKIALGVGAVVLIGGIAYLALKGKLGAKTVTVTASSSNPSAVTPTNEPILTNGNWSFSQTVATDGSSTVTINFNNVSTWLGAGTGTTIVPPYPLANFSVTKDTTGQLGNALLLPINTNGTLWGVMIQGGTNAVINGTLVITGTVPVADRPSSAITKTETG